MFEPLRPTSTASPNHAVKTIPHLEQRSQSAHSRSSAHNLPPIFVVDRNGRQSPSGPRQPRTGNTLMGLTQGLPRLEQMAHEHERAFSNLNLCR